MPDSALPGWTSEAPPGERVHLTWVVCDHSGANDPCDSGFSVTARMRRPAAITSVSATA
jgi:hypothetical protein